MDRTSKEPTPTEIRRTAGIPLGRLSSSSGTGLRRILPASETPKPPVAAFDSAL